MQFVDEFRDPELAKSLLQRFQSEKEDTGERSEECGDIRFYKRRSGSSD